MTLRAEHCRFAYSRRGPTVLDGVCAEFHPGRLTAILGPNGSGKSTLIRLLMGVRRPDSGRCTLDGASLSALPAHARAARMAYIPQRGEVAFPFTLRQVIALGRHALPHDPAAADAALSRVGLLDRAEEPFGILSIGQQQRATLARALAQLAPPRPTAETDATRVLLADEPVSAMDPLFAIRAMSLLREMARSGIAVACVLHDFTLASRFADDVLILDDHGRVAAAGPTAEAMAPDTLARVFHVRFATLRADPAAGDSLTALVPTTPIAQAE